MIVPVPGCDGGALLHHRQVGGAHRAAADAGLGRLQHAQGRQVQADHTRGQLEIQIQDSPHWSL